MKQMQWPQNVNRNLPPNIFLSAMMWSNAQANANDPATADMMYLAAMSNYKKIKIKIKILLNAMRGHIGY